MTSDFDHLMGIWSESRKNQKFKPIADWLADICVLEAGTKKKDWNFENWKRTKWGATVLAVNGEDALKWEFLNNCHDVLDHTQWHLKVFKSDTQCLIRVVYELFNGQDRIKRDLKPMIKRHLPKLLEFIHAFGVDEDKYTIKLKGVERAKYY